MWLQLLLFKMSPYFIIGIAHLEWFYFGKIIWNYTKSYYKKVGWVEANSNLKNLIYLWNIILKQELVSIDRFSEPCLCLYTYTQTHACENNYIISL